jgi:hypothetical protein
VAKFIYRKKTGIFIKFSDLGKPIESGGKFKIIDKELPTFLEEFERELKEYIIPIPPDICKVLQEGLWDLN